MVSKWYCEMETSRMKRYDAFQPQILLDLHHEVMGVAAKAESLAEVAKEHFLYTQVKAIIEHHYDLGKVKEVYQIFGGYINTTFGVYTEKNGEMETWLFRKYKRGKELEALLFEHKLLLHARKNGFSFGAVHTFAKDGKTYHMEMQVMPEGERPSILPCSTISAAPTGTIGSPTGPMKASPM